MSFRYNIFYLGVYHAIKHEIRGHDTVTTNNRQRRCLRFGRDGRCGVRKTRPTVPCAMVLPRLGNVRARGVEWSPPSSHYLRCHGPANQRAFLFVIILYDYIPNDYTITITITYLLV
ncbi:Uncharacterized protein FWK35_00008049 [Aphis craccivora]|uniref:Uncharacterized protein n=1 Tax=Aphis craccivora TaxID=307492 RepID=A0A6G0ZN16_APHCR|nr:Uncharacterized protein FWK35_00008049 [Aphis craccivora]